MNIHHLELFYHVVVHQGVSHAARVLDKEQPTLSRQINELEDSLRTRLYHRRPFGLTEKGETLFRAIEPFFRDLPKLEAKVRGGDTIQIGASTIILADHLPAVEKKVRGQFPNLRLVLRESNQPRLLQGLERGEIDLAITLLPAQLPQKTFAQPLLQIPLVLLVPKASPLRSAAQLWKQVEIRENLICLMQDELICHEFQETLKQEEVDWRPPWECSGGTIRTSSCAPSASKSRRAPARSPHNLTVATPWNFSFSLQPSAFSIFPLPARPRPHNSNDHLAQNDLRHQVPRPRCRQFPARHSSLRSPK